MEKLMCNRKCTGFTLIEVLLALAIVAIAFSALYKAISASILQTQQLKEKTIKHWVAMQGIHLIQLGLLPLTQQPMTKKTMMLEHLWYWQINWQQTPVPSIDILTITVSASPSGPFTDPLQAFYYHPLPQGQIA